MPFTHAKAMNEPLFRFSFSVSKVPELEDDAAGGSGVVVLRLCGLDWDETGWDGMLK